VSFLVILLVYNKLNLGGTSSSDICHNSVILKSKSAGLAGGLTCRTDYICISGGGNCNNLIISPGMTITVNANNKTQIMKVLADQLANCWYTFGEGKMDYLELNVPQQAITGGKGCGVCSVISFDSVIQGLYSGTVAPQTYATCNLNTDCTSGDCDPTLHVCVGYVPNELTYRDFINYLATTNKDSSQTYLQYLYGVSTVQDFISQSSTVSQFYNSGLISVADQFSIVTGESKGALPFWHIGNFLPPILLRTTDISKYLSDSCGGNFFTQAS
jgi:hypothetical protein